jgi:hypothetical protein
LPGVTDIYYFFASHALISRKMAGKLLSGWRIKRYMFIRYPDGSSAEGVIHRLEGGTVRAVVAGADDAIEYRLIRDQWTSDRGLVVTFEFPTEMGVDTFQIMPVMAGEREARCAAGGDCVLRRKSDLGTGPVN